MAHDDTAALGKFGQWPDDMTDQTLQFLIGLYPDAPETKLLLAEVRRRKNRAAARRRRDREYIAARLAGPVRMTK